MMSLHRALLFGFLGLWGVCCGLFLPETSAATAAERPNILWISVEDISPDLGCYGDPYAITPHLDKFAAEGVRYTRCFAHAGVCAPARTGLITGMYPSSIGTHHMRCQGVPTNGVRCFPEYLRAAGYYCTNNSKTDYQFAPPVTAWDESSNKADWRGRTAEQPFFCVINLTTTHESQIRDPSPATRRLVEALPPEKRHDPQQAVVPAYYPDTPRVRQDLANYADIITAMDQQVADILQRLADDGLAEDTIVWFWGDHGRGLPRGKRWLYDSGTLVPLMVRVPEKWRERVAPGQPESLAPGSVNGELVSFIDFAPTVLSLAEVKLPTYFQGQPFLGTARPAEPRQYVHGHRDRMDEAYDLIRMVRDRRFKYFRNFMPDVSYGQDIWYMNQMPTMQELRRLHAEGTLSAAAALYFRPTKPVEELFDTDADPDELHNLADDPRYADDLKRLRAECQRWMTSIGDIGLIVEPIFDELKRPGNRMQTTPSPQIMPGDTPPTSRQARLSPPWEGISVAYALLPVDALDDREPQWRLSWGQWIDIPAGQQLLVKGCRLGFRDSPVTRWQPGQPLPVMPRVMSAPHWRDVVDRGDLLQRLWQLKSHDGRTDAETLHAYRTALNDPSPAMRYWGLRGALALVDDADREQWQATLRRLRRDDPSPTLQILAASTLARWTSDAAEVKFLAEQMLSATQPSERLHAAIALRELGEQSRSVLPQLEEAAKGSEYVSRVSREAVATLTKP